MKFSTGELETNPDLLSQLGNQLSGSGVEVSPLCEDPYCKSSRRIEVANIKSLQWGPISRMSLKDDSIKSDKTVLQGKSVRPEKEPLQPVLLTDPRKIAADVRAALETSKRLWTFTNSEGLRIALNNYSDQYTHILARSKGEVKILVPIENDRDAKFVKKALDIGVEIRHIEQKPQPAFSLTDWKLFTTMDRMEGTNVVNHLLMTQNPLYVEQYEEIFRKLWDGDSVDARERIHELEEGVSPRVTKIIHNPLEIVSTIKSGCETSTKSLSFYTDSENLVMGLKLLEDSYKKAIRNHASQKSPQGFRWLVQIEAGQSEEKRKAIIEVAKELLSLGIQLRHIDATPMLKFALKDSEELYATLESGLEGNVVLNVLFSNEPAYVRQFEELFEQSWRKARDARLRIRELEEGIEPDKTEIISDVSEAAKMAKDCFEHSEKEILIVLASQQVIERNLPLYEEMIETTIKKKIAVRVLVPVRNGEAARFLEKVDWRAIDEMNVGYAIYDRKRMLITQYARAADRSGSLNRIQANIFTTNREHIAGIVSVFDALWKETELRETAERSQRRAELFQDILSHDLRNHLQVIVLSAEQLQEETQGNKDLEPLIKNMVAALERSISLLDRARQLGKLISEKNPKLQAENLVDALDKSMELVRKANPDKQVEYTKTVPYSEAKQGEASLTVRADDMLVEVFSNIFANSVKYTDSKGVKIAVGIELVKDGAPEQEFWKISLADWGTGIAQEMKERIFHRYMGGARGTGLGLSIVQSLVVDRYKGRADVKDRVPGSESEGTVVDVWLPKA